MLTFGIWRRRYVERKLRKDWTGFWKELKNDIKKGYQQKRKIGYMEKVMQSQVFAEQEKEKHMCLISNMGYTYFA